MSFNVDFKTYIEYSCKVESYFEFNSKVILYFIFIVNYYRQKLISKHFTHDWNVFDMK